MEDKIISLDFDRNIGEVTLSDGETVLPIPRLSNKKVIQIVKFLGVDVYKLYDRVQDIFSDQALDEFEKLAAVMDEIKEEQLVHILAILLEIDDRVALDLAPDETLDILLVYSEAVNVKNLYQKVRKLMEQMFGKELPEPGKIMETVFPKEVPEDQAADQKEPEKKPEKEPASKTAAASLTDS